MRQTSIAFRNAAVGFATQVVASVVGLVMVPFIVHSVGDAAYGVFLLAFSIEMVLDLLRNALSRTSMVVVAQCRETGEDEKINRVVSAAVLFALFPAGIGFLVLAGGGELFYRFFGVPESLHAEALIVMALAGVAVLVTFPMYPLQGVLSGYQSHHVVYLVMLAFRLLRAGLVYALLTWVRPSVVCVMLATALCLIGTQAAMAAMAWRLRPTLRIRLRGVTRADFRPLVAFGSYLVLSQILLTINNQGGHWVVGKALGMQYITYLSIAMMVMILAYRVVQQVTVVLAPIAGRYQALGATETLQELFQRGSRYSILMLAALMCGLLPMVDVFLRLWMKEPYVWLAPYAGALGATAALTASSSLALQVLHGTGEARKPFWGMLVATAGGLATMIVSVTVFDAGFGGVVAGLCVGQFLRWLLLTAIALRAIGGSKLRLAWNGYGQPLIAAAPAVAVVLRLRAWLKPASWGMLVAVMTVGAGVLALAMLPFLNRLEWQILRAGVGRLRRLLGRHRTA